MTAAEQGTGTLIVVVGPSGAGKDSVMGFAARHFAERPDILFVRRVITRPSDAGSEVHESVSDAEFEEMRRSGIFAVFWRAHGLSYGIPAEISEKVAAGMTAIVNGSRAALPAIRQAFGKIAVVVITSRPAGAGEAVGGARPGERRRCPASSDAAGTGPDRRAGRHGDRQ